MRDETQFWKKENDITKLIDLTTKKVRAIHLIPKWWPMNYYFVCISPLCLMNMYKEQTNFGIENEAKTANKQANK